MSIRIQTAARTVDAPDGHGRLLTEAAHRAGIQLNTRCSGAGVCRGCTCKLGPGRYAVSGEPVEVVAGAYRVVLACQTRVLSEDADIYVPNTSLVEQGAQIDHEIRLPTRRGIPVSRKVALKLAPDGATDTARIADALAREAGVAGVAMPLPVLRRLAGILARDDRRVTVSLGRDGPGWTLLDVEPGDTTARHFGVAVDIGTTTVAALLVDLTGGVVLAKASMYNQQIAMADDVASRISGSAAEGGLERLQRLVVDGTVNVLVETLCEEADVRPREIIRIALAGNTVMSHLFLGLSPEGIGVLPFRPVTTEYPPCPARTLGLSIHPDAVVDVVPSVAGYIGGDLTADIHIARLRRHSRPALLVDMGTNGEIVYSEGDRMVACATAAGPAFEGYGITHGCRAAAGAIEHLRYDETLRMELDVIGGGVPSGLCGSGIIDFIGCGLRCGLISPMGRYDRDRLRVAGRLLDDPGLCGNSLACRITPLDAPADAPTLFVTEQDLSQVMKAKAAIYAGIKTLLASQDRTVDDLDTVFLAGGFARYIDLAQAVCIGLLPELPPDRYQVIGNGSLAGAFLALVDAEAMEAYRGLIHLPELVELNRQPDFETHFIDALALPSLDPDAFPQTRKTLPS